MNIGKYSTILVSVLLAGILIGTVGIPIIDGIANETNTVSNSGAQWVRMAYVTDDSDYSFTVHMNDNDTVTITNGEDVQTGPADDIILYADELHTVFIKDGVLCTLGENSYGNISGGPIDEGYDLTVKRVSGAVSMTARFGASWGSPAWAYVPISGADYSSFGADAVPLHKTSSALAVNGEFAGVYANHVGVIDTQYDYGLVMDADVTADYINSVQWVQESELIEEPLEIDPLNPDVINPLDPGVIVDPFDPGQIQPIDIDPIPIDPGNQIMSVPTPTYTDGDWGFDVDANGRISIVSYSGTGGNITVPKTVTYNGTPTNVAYFGKGTSNSPVFDDSNISDFTLTFPSGWGGAVAAIKPYACYQCTHLKSLTCESKLEYSIQGYAFYHCTGLQSVSLVNQGVYDQCFEGCTSLSNIDFEDITYIGSSAFKGCTSLPDTIVFNGTQLGAGCFENCTSLKSVTATVTYQMSSDVFKNCTSLETLVINRAINYAERNMCEGCTSLTSVTLNGAKGIPEYAFKGCTSLTTIELPSTVTAIYVGAFMNSGIESITIPNTVSDMRTSVFRDCTSLETVTLPTSLTTIPADTFRGCTSLESAYLPDNITVIGMSAFYGCTGMGPTLVLPSNIQTISAQAFYGCTSIENLVVMTDAEPATGGGYNEAFSNTGITQVLNLSDTEWTTTSYGLNAEEVSDHIDADNYLAIVSYTETVQKTGAVYDMVNLLPIVMTAGLLIACVWYFTRK